MIHLKSHAALVTGSTKGVGRAIAQAFAQAGADVVIHGRAMSDDAQSVLDRCRRAGVKADFIDGDLSDADTGTAVDRVFRTALAVDPRLDILVNNAGQYFDVPFLDMTVERFEKTMRLNVASAYFLTQRFAHHWVEHKTAGRVLMIGSINGRLAEPVSTAYDTSKGAVEMMVKTLAVALAPMNIRVNGLAPGLVRTPQTAWIDQRPEEADWVRLHTPNGQVPDADVCGPGAVYLVSDAAQHVHGQMLLIDGGMSAWQQPARPS
ncbi:MAG: SDR family oxidoreductase [Planctomycetes bacterium]|nr:SDR family oxidoreductase [Planctomycetota bacterium]